MRERYSNSHQVNCGLSLPLRTFLTQSRIYHSAIGLRSLENFTGVGVGWGGGNGAVFSLFFDSEIDSQTDKPLTVQGKTLITMAANTNNDTTCIQYF